ncbi:heterokaryon incompatibility protein-domain-containing protein [Xylariaceae sp. FL1272]|nr:heterokaryon incompatibility protein-domain-containing protein [Xylariaceae sp. FL1272]
MGMSTYRYKSLGDNEIRLLILYPGQFDADIRVSLRHFQLPELPGPYPVTALLVEEIDESNDALMNDSKSVSAFSREIGIGMIGFSSDADGFSRYLENYEALSYVWGSPDKSCHVYVDEVDEGSVGGSIPVTANLDRALRSLRPRDKPRVLWADAVCIDQKNVEEKNNQIPLMGHIYRLSVRTIVWLGEHSQCSQVAMNSLARLDAKMPGATWNWDFYTERQLPDTSKGLELAKKEIEAICTLLARPWFERLWTRQEYIVSYAKIVACGETTISWPSFCNGVLLTWSILSNTQDSEGLPAGWKEVVNRAVAVCKTEMPLRYGDLRCYLGPLRWTEPRDAIYAVRNLLTTVNYNLPVHPDYSAPVAQIFEDVAAKVACNLQDLDFLSTCEPHQMGNPPLGLPSWVPDWSTRMRAQRRFESPWSACSWISGHVRYVPEARQLWVKTIPFARVQRVFNHQIHSDRLDELARLEAIWGYTKQIKPISVATNTEHESTFSPILEMWRQTARPVIEHIWELLFPQVYAGHSERRRERWLLRRLVERCSRALAACERFDNDNLDSNLSSGLSFQTASDVVSTAWFSNHGLEQILEAIPRAQKYLLACAESLAGRVFFTTPEGYAGVAPIGTLPGDIICVVLGCKNPICLRPVIGPPLRWGVIGGAFVPGAMAGEMIHGPLPKYYRPVFAGEDAHGGVNGYDIKLTETGEEPEGIAKWNYDRRGKTYNPRMVLEDTRIDVHSYKTDLYSHGVHELVVTEEALKTAGVTLEEMCLL